MTLRVNVCYPRVHMQCVVVVVVVSFHFIPWLIMISVVHLSFKKLEGTTNVRLNEFLNT